MKNIPIIFPCILTAILLFCVVDMHSQVVNIGQVTIEPGTQVSMLDDFVNMEQGDFLNDGELFVYRNFQNEGFLAFTPGQTTSLTRFEGKAGAQAISGSMPSEFFDVLFKNTMVQPAFELSGDIYIYGAATFNEGIVDGDAHGGLVTFYPGATHDQVSNSSFVDGQVRKIGDEPFDYPIGDGGYYRRSFMTSPSNSSHHFTSQYTMESSNALYPHSSKEEKIERIDDAEYWEFNRTEGDSDIVLTLTWNEDTTPTEILNAGNEYAIHIVRWSNTENRWIDEGGTADTSSNSVTTAVSGYGIFTLASVLVEEEPGGEEESVVVYNAVSPDGDGMNDFFYIEGLENYPDNTLEIYNRWGTKVFGAEGYGLDNNWFRGYSEGRVTIDNGKLLPAGTYFYVLRYVTENGNMDGRTGYLYIE